MDAPALGGRVRIQPVPFRGRRAARRRSEPEGEGRRRQDPLGSDLRPLLSQGNGCLLAAQRRTLRMTVLRKTGPSPRRYASARPVDGVPGTACRNFRGAGGLQVPCAYGFARNSARASRNGRFVGKSEKPATGRELRPCAPAVRRKGKRLVRTNDAFRRLAPASPASRRWHSSSRSSLRRSSGIQQFLLGSRFLRTIVPTPKATVHEDRLAADGKRRAVRRGSTLAAPASCAERSVPVPCS